MKKRLNKKKILDNGDVILTFIDKVSTRSCLPSQFISSLVVDKTNHVAVKTYTICLSFVKENI